jgi:hypothetical protein
MTTFFLLGAARYTSKESQNGEQGLPTVQLALSLCMIDRCATEEKPPAATRMQTPWSCKGAPACTVDNQESALSSPSDSQAGARSTAVSGGARGAVRYYCWLRPICSIA